MLKQRSMLAMILAGLALFASHAVFGQAGRTPDWQVNVKEIRMDRVRNVDPGYRFPGITPDQTSEWIRIYVVYELDAGTGQTLTGEDARWADNVEFDWSVILPREYRGKLHPKYSVRLKRKITYDSVREGEGNIAILFIHPRTYERYKKDLARDMALVRVMVRIDGKTRAEAYARGRDSAPTRGDAGKMFPEFARTPVWFDWEEVPAVSGAVSRMDTPWAHSGTFFRIAKEEGK